MKFKSNSIPEPSEGVSFEGIESLVLPDQSLSLKEILERFTRGEALPIGMETNYGDEDDENPLNVDLEKLVHADLVDKAEYAERLKDVQKTYQKQEADKAAEAAKAAKLAAEAARQKEIRIAARKLAKESSKS